MPKPFVFISYRRDDAAGTAGRLGDWLEREYGRRRVFRDLTIEAAERFQEVIDSALDDCNIQLAVIGRSWVDEWNRRRLSNEEGEDFVRHELLTALDRGIPIIPVFVDDTPVPDAKDLPADIRPVVALNGVRVHNLEFAHDFVKLDAAIKAAVREPPGRLAPDGMRYREIPAGTFDLGAVRGDKDADDDERPLHRVKISQSFHLSVTQVTVCSYERFTEDAGIAMPPPPNFNPGWNRKDHPIVRVTWDQAQQYCAWVGGRLPTEAEWERAARGHRKGLKYPFGKALSRNQAVWFQQGKHPPWHPRPAEDWRMNDFGLVHMVGNVWEWVADWYDPDEYVRQAKEATCEDPHGPPKSPQDQRVVRGGSWADKLAAQRISNRRGLEPETISKEVGFRCVLDTWPT